MTDNEIIKALECCAKAKDFTQCEKLRCPLYRECKNEHQRVFEILIEKERQDMIKEDEKNDLDD